MGAQSSSRPEPLMTRLARRESKQPATSKSPKPLQQRQPQLSASLSSCGRFSSPWKQRQPVRVATAGTVSTAAGSPVSSNHGGSSPASSITMGSLSPFEGFSSNRSGKNQSVSPCRRCPSECQTQSLAKPGRQQLHQRLRQCEAEREQHMQPLLSPFFPMADSGDGFSPASPSMQPMVKLHAPHMQQQEEPPPFIASPTDSCNAEQASIELCDLRSALAELKHRLSLDQCTCNQEHMRSSLALAQRGLAVLERCQGL